MAVSIEDGGPTIAKVVRGSLSRTGGHTPHSGGRKVNVTGGVPSNPLVPKKTRPPLDRYSRRSRQIVVGPVHPAETAAVVLGRHRPRPPREDDHLMPMTSPTSTSASFLCSLSSPAYSGSKAALMRRVDSSRAASTLS